MLTFVDRAPEALAFFDRCDVRFLFVKGHGDQYFDGAPGSVGSGRVVELISANDLGGWKDAVAV
jgi:hypothetical protein